MAGASSPNGSFPYVARLVRETALYEALPGLAPTGLTTFDDPGFWRLHPLLLAGSIAEVVAFGGACGNGPPMAQALAVTQQWLNEAFGDRYEDLRIAETQGAWTDWFYDVLPSWDRTWLVTDVARQRATLFCVTDTD